ncbi:hypothetical protein RIF29_00250 [Crotalaria pallida]|uniref:Uncharacterized protein n=1 Tax=Crotalaria pallida TaxID=3830 RepID=A0AAN9P6X7_CROPI
MGEKVCGREKGRRCVSVRGRSGLIRGDPDPGLGVRLERENEEVEVDGVEDMRENKGWWVWENGVQREREEEKKRKVEEDD